MGTRIWRPLPASHRLVLCSLFCIFGWTECSKCGLQTGLGLSLELRGHWWMLNVKVGSLSLLPHASPTVRKVVGMFHYGVWGYCLPVSHRELRNSLATPWVLLGDPDACWESLQIWLGLPCPFHGCEPSIWRDELMYLEINVLA